MEKHSKISFWKTPGIYLRNKYHKGINRPGYYIPSLVPTAMVIISFTIGLTKLFSLEPHNIIKLLIIWFGFYGLINLFLLKTLLRYEIRVKRSRDLFDAIRSKISEPFRDVFSERLIGSNFDKETFENTIKQRLEVFNSSIIEGLFGENVTISLKYAHNGKLHALRHGNAANHLNNNNKTPEKFSSSPIFTIFANTDIALEYIFVQNLENADNNEKNLIGECGFNKVKRRAGGLYKTFIAIPIYSGDTKNYSGQLATKGFLGYILLTLNKPYGFGDFERFHCSLINIFTDSISVLIDGLNQAAIPSKQKTS